MHLDLKIGNKNKNTREKQEERFLWPVESSDGKSRLSDSVCNASNPDCIGVDSTFGPQLGSWSWKGPSKCRRRRVFGSGMWSGCLPGRACLCQAGRLSAGPGPCLPWLLRALSLPCGRKLSRSGNTAKHWLDPWELRVWTQGRLAGS